MDEQESLNIEDSTAMLPDGEYIHTFRNPAGILIGADWSRIEILEKFTECGVRRSGGMATRMKHGLVFIDNGKPVFVETK